MSLVIVAFAVAPNAIWVLTLLGGTPVFQFPELFQLPLTLPIHVNTPGAPTVIGRVGIAVDRSGSTRMLVVPFPGSIPLVPSFLRPMIGGFGPVRLLTPPDGPDTAVTSSVPTDRAWNVNVPISI